MLPVWEGSPKVMPPAVVTIWASSALLMARPVPEVPPTLMGWPGWAVRITTPPAAGSRANSLTVSPPALATKRLPLRVEGQGELGRLRPVSVAVGVVLPGANSLTVLPMFGWPRRDCH